MGPMEKDGVGQAKKERCAPKSFQTQLSKSLDYQTHHVLHCLCALGSYDLGLDMLQ